MAEHYDSHEVRRILKARLPHEKAEGFWDISINDAKLSKIEPSQSDQANATSKSVFGNRRLAAPSLCHAHVHLDKCFLLQDDKYRDLQIEDGDFQEALALTNRAKERFDEADLLRRGRRLIDESIQAGVTAMRAFVEVDEIVQLRCVTAARQLKAEYEDLCHIQICAFAQLPVFIDDDTGKTRRDLMSQALVNGVEVVGSTPYVEKGDENVKKNVDWAISLALEKKLNLDFHLDYNLDADAEPLIWYVVEQLQSRGWMKHIGNMKTICVSHCTLLSLSDDASWSKLKAKIGDLPLHFVGLPLSDLFMMGRAERSLGRRVRGTLPVLDMIKDFELNSCIAINNLGNAFTPSGSCDPLSLASFCVSVYQAGTTRDCGILYEAISTRARHAIGLSSEHGHGLEEGSPADLCIYGASGNGKKAPKSIAELVYYVPRERTTIFQGHVLHHDREMHYQ